MRFHCSQIGAALFCMLLCAGCGRKEVPTPDVGSRPESTAKSSPDSKTAPIPDPADGNTERTPNEVWEDAEGRKFLGKVPYDVFFDDPLEVASDETPVVSVAEARDKTSAMTGNTGGQVEAPPDSAGQESGDPPAPASQWATLLSADRLDTEIKSARNFLNQKLPSVGTYNSAIRMIPAKAATIAVLAGIAEQHSGDISWKSDAAYVRDLAAKMNSTTLQRGPKDQRRLLSLFENLSDTLNRSRPAGLDKPRDDATLADAAEMRLVMMRMEEAEQTLRTQISESGFRSSADQVRHEASLIAALMKAMTTESYGYADDPEFLQHAAGILEAASGLRDATESGSYADFELQLSKLSTTCQDCHRAYKNN